MLPNGKLTKKKNQKEFYVFLLVSNYWFYICKYKKETFQYVNETTEGRIIILIVPKPNALF